MASPSTVENNGNVGDSRRSSRAASSAWRRVESLCFLEERELPRDGAGIREVLALGERPRRHVEVVAHAPVAGGEDRAEERPVPGRERRPRGGALGEVAQERVALEELGLVLGQQARERAGQPGERLVVLAGVGAPEHFRRPGEERPQQQRELLARQAGLEEADDQLAEQAEEVLAVVRTLEVGPVAQERRLEAVDQQLGAAERVEVLVHGLGERGAHAVQPGHGVQERQVAVGDDHRLRRVGEIGAKGVRVERYW